MKAIKNTNYITLTAMLLLLVLALSSVAMAEEEDEPASREVEDVLVEQLIVVEEVDDEVVDDDSAYIAEVIMDPEENLEITDSVTEPAVDSEQDSVIQEEAGGIVVDEIRFNEEQIEDVINIDVEAKDSFDESETVPEAPELAVPVEDNSISIIPLSKEDCLQHLRAYYTHPGACMRELAR
jgi:hypothetical protein